MEVLILVLRVLRTLLRALHRVDLLLLHFEILFALSEHLIQFEVRRVGVGRAKGGLGVLMSVARLVDDLDLLLMCSAQLELTDQLVDAQGLDRRSLRVLGVCQALLVTEVRVLLLRS